MPPANQQPISINGIFASDANLSVTDITTNNASSTKHGFLAKVPNVAANILDGTGTWVTGAWASWTPTWTTITIGNATQACKYVQIGKTVTARIDVTFGNSTSVGTGKPTFTLPVTAASITAGLLMGAVRYNAGGVLALGQIGYSDTTHGLLTDFLANGTYVTEDQFTSGAPGTWATSSTIGGTFTYEAA